ncbi:sensor histidine kinase [Almyronema epifaneia]|uniref:histidine kinase n=1 Tax=Almyronema epifaneia S1 TaxID=2991925 RepID=A0ABW6ICU9_9CYAN
MTYFSGSDDSSAAADLSLTQLQGAYQRALETAHFKAGFLARTAHELRSPLNHIISLNQLILNDLCDDPAEERELIAQSYQGAMKMLQLLDQLIQVSKLEIGRAQPQIEAFPVAQLFERVQQQVQLQVRDRGMQLQIQPFDPSLQILADCRWLTQIWVSLIESSVETVQTGAIQLGAELADLGQVCIWLQDGRSPADWHQLSQHLQNPSPVEESLVSPDSVVLPISLRILIAQSTLAAMAATLAVQPALAASREHPHLRLVCHLPLAQ